MTVPSAQSPDPVDLPQDQDAATQPGSDLPGESSERLDHVQEVIDEAKDSARTALGEQEPREDSYDPGDDPLPEANRAPDGAPQPPAVPDTEHPDDEPEREAAG